MKKKIILIIISIIVVFLVGLLFILHQESKSINLKSDVFTYELGEEISADVSEYLKDADSTKNINEYKIVSDDFQIVDNKLVINNEMIKAGEYTISVVHKKLSKNVIIRIVDSTSPEFIKFQDKIELEQTTEDIDLTKYFEAKDLTEVSITIEGEYDLNREGEYKIDIVATDSNNNKTSKKTTIKVQKKEEKETPVAKKETSNNTTSKKEESKPSSNNGVSNNSQSQQPAISSPRYRKDISDSYVVQVNAYRKANGLNELPVTAEAQAEADRRAKELSSYYSHDGVGYGFGEIIGNGSIGVDFIQAWKNSPSHNATMLRDHTVAIAASVYEYNNKWYTIVSFRMDY